MGNPWPPVLPILQNIKGSLRREAELADKVKFVFAMDHMQDTAFCLLDTEHLVQQICHTRLIIDIAYYICIPKYSLFGLYNATRIMFSGMTIDIGSPMCSSLEKAVFPLSIP